MGPNSSCIQYEPVLGFDFGVGLMIQAICCENSTSFLIKLCFVSKEDIFRACSIRRAGCYYIDTLLRLRSHDAGTF